MSSAVPPYSSAAQASFLRLFPSGLIILNGGMESGLKRMEEEEEGARMFRVHGGQQPVLTQVLGEGDRGQAEQCCVGGPGLELHEPRRHLRAGLGQEDLCVGWGSELG